MKAIAKYKIYDKVFFSAGLKLGGVSTTIYDSVVSEAFGNIDFIIVVIIIHWLTQYIHTLSTIFRAPTC